MAESNRPVSAPLDTQALPPLNLEDERAKFEAWMKSRPGYPFAGAFANLAWAAWQGRANNSNSVEFGGIGRDQTSQKTAETRMDPAFEGGTNGAADMLNDYNDWLAKRGPLGVGAVPERLFFAGWLAARRAGAAVAPIDQALPPLPEAREVRDRQEGESDTRYALYLASCDAWNHCLHKCRKVIAPYAARIAHLERELKQAKLQQLADIGQDIERELAERKPVPKLYTCIGKGGEYELIGEAIPAGVLSSTLMVSGYTVYRNVNNGKMFVRTASDFYQRMTRIAAAPSPQSKQEEAE